jgi:hypothetical protein
LLRMFGERALNESRFISLKRRQAKFAECGKRLRSSGRSACVGSLWQPTAASAKKPRYFSFAKSAAKVPQVSAAG